MSDGLIEEAAALLERRFLKNAFLPVLVFLPAVTAPALVVQQGRLESLVHIWDAQSGTVKILEAVAYFTFTWFVSAILASQWRNIIRLFEGYPLRRLLPRLCHLAEDWHRRQKAELLSDPAWYRKYYGYSSDPSETLPSRLGNILLSAERYPYERYGADTIILWPRLYHVMPRAYVDDVEDARANLEFLLVISLWCASFGLVNALVLPPLDSPAILTAACFAGGLLAAYLAYASALRAATEYGEQLRVGMELYRFDLLQRLKVPLPSSLSEERKAWDRVTGLIGKGRPSQAWAYTDPRAPELLLTIR